MLYHNTKNILDASFCFAAMFEGELTQAAATRGLNIRKNWYMMIQTHRGVYDCKSRGYG